MLAWANGEASGGFSVNPSLVVDSGVTREIATCADCINEPTTTMTSVGTFETNYHLNNGPKPEFWSVPAGDAPGVYYGIFSEIEPMLPSNWYTSCDVIGFSVEADALAHVRKNGVAFTDYELTDPRPPTNEPSVPPPLSRSPVPYAPTSLENADGNGEKSFYEKHHAEIFVGVCSVLVLIIACLLAAPLFPPPINAPVDNIPSRCLAPSTAPPTRTSTTRVSPSRSTRATAAHTESSR